MIQALEFGRFTIIWPFQKEKLLGNINLDLFGKMQLIQISMGPLTGDPISKNGLSPRGPWLVTSLKTFI